MSAYENDPRVQLHGDGTATVLNVSWDRENWRIVESGDGGFYAVSADSYLVVVREGWHAHRFATRDAAIGAVADQ